MIMNMPIAAFAPLPKIFCMALPVIPANPPPVVGGSDSPGAASSSVIAAYSSSPPAGDV